MVFEYKLWVKSNNFDQRVMQAEYIMAQNNFDKRAMQAEYIMAQNLCLGNFLTFKKLIFNILQIFPTLRVPDLATLKK